MTKTNSLVVWKDVQSSFEAISKLEGAAKEIKSKRNEGTIKAYSLIIAHLEVSGAGTEKRDAVAKETFEALLKLNVTKAKARRYVENAQAWRRHEECSSSPNPQENLDEFKAYEIEKESDLVKFLFPKPAKPWYETAIKHMIKEVMAAEAANGEAAGKKRIEELGSEWDMAYRDAYTKAQKLPSPVLEITPPEEKKSPNPKTKPAKPPRTKKQK